MNKHYDISEVIKYMEFGEVAVKVSGDDGDERFKTGEAVYYDKEDDGVLKTTDGSVLTLRKRISKSENQDRFVIMSREDFDKNIE